MMHPKAVSEGHVLSFYTSSATIASVDELMLDNTRAEEVAKEYGLKADKMAIVVVNVTDTAGGKGNANFILVKEDKWLMFKID